jgi:peptidoglycan/xylan/chitin deacetylase (PgdA/CDA1 family)
LTIAAQAGYAWVMGVLASLKQTVSGGRILRRGPATARRVALTFDDGPDHLTPAYLDALDAAGVPATFFIMGDRSSNLIPMVREYQRRGHQVAAHGWDHRAFPDLSPGELRWHLRRTEAVLGPRPTVRPWVRPPYGRLSIRSVAQVLAEGFTIAMWSFEAGDHDVASADALVARVSPGKVEPGEVILLHEGSTITLAALPRIVANLQAEGFECVTMSDLFAV